MHEYSVTKSLVEICNQEAKKNNIGKIRTIKLKLGKFTGFSPEAINFYFGFLKKDTRCENAKIEFFEIPVRIRCPDCNYENDIDEPIFLCPSCGRNNIEILSGRELFIESIEGE